MHECEKCGFKTSRLDTFKRHLNRKNPCKGSLVVNPTVNPNGGNVNPNGGNVNLIGGNVNPNVNHVNPDLQDKSIANSTSKYSCENCGKIFTTRQAKSRHRKNVNCKSPPVVCQPVVETQSPQHEEEPDDTICPYCDKSFSRVDSLKRHMVRCKFKNYGGNVTNNNTTNNINNNTTNNTNSHNTINNYTINYNSYDRPSIDHVTKEHVKNLYLGNNRNLKKLIYAGVCEIWKKKENNSFKLPFQKTNGKVKVPKKIFRDNEPVEVYADGQERLFPADHVVEVVLQKAAEVCESYLRQHYNEETIPGRGVLKHADVLEELACNFQEVWDDDKAFRSGYKPFVRTALLECMRAREEQVEKKDNNDNDENEQSESEEGE